MKMRPLILTSPNFSPFNGISPNLLSYIQTKRGAAGFTNCAHTISASSQNIALFLKTDSIFPSRSALPYTSETIAGERSQYSLSSLVKYINIKSSKTTCLRFMQLWSLCLLLLVSNYAFAQTKVSGKVIIERTSALPVGGTITAKNTNVFTVADEAGKFTYPDHYHNRTYKRKKLLPVKTTSSCKAGGNWFRITCWS